VLVSHKENNMTVPELIPWQDHNAKCLTAADYLAGLRASGAPEANVAALETMIRDLAEAAQEAYSDLHQVEYLLFKNLDYRSSSARAKLQVAAAKAGFELKPWEGK
jgi:hypothetical protein